MRMDADSRRIRWRRRLAGLLLCCWIVMPSTQAAAQTPDATGAKKPDPKKKDPETKVDPKARVTPKAKAAPKVKVAPKPKAKVAPKVKVARKAKSAPKAVAARTADAALPAAAVSAEGGDASTTLSKTVKAKKKLKPWRGSQFAFGNTFSTVSLAPNELLTYNPTYYMSFKFKPRWWFNKMFYVRANLSVIKELTEPDTTTYVGEALLSDLTLVAGAAKFYTIPKAKIVLSADLALTFPTSKSSQAATLAMAIGPNVRMHRTFKVLKGLTVGASLRVTPYFHRYSTRQRKDPLIPCTGDTANCDAFLNTGGRNAVVRVSPSLDADLMIKKWVGVSLTYGWFIDRLRPVSGDYDGNPIWEPMPDQNHRYLSYFGASAYFIPMKSLMVMVNYETFAPQLSPDSTFYNPFGNLYTTITLDLILRVDGLIAMLGGK